jgi:hypothetical protein
VVANSAPYVSPFIGFSGDNGIAKGLEVTETLLVRIQNFHQRRTLPNSIRVLVPLSRHERLKRDQQWVRMDTVLN